MAKLRFSIVLPIRNGAVFLAEALASAVAQTRPADEILVVDDASTDDSAAIAQSERWAGRLRYHYNTQATGFADAFNRAAAMATGDYVTILHQDDLLDPDYLRHIEQALELYPQTQHLYAACRYIDSQGVTTQTPPPPHSLTPVLYTGGEYAQRYFQGVLANQHIHRCPGVTTRRELLLTRCAYRQEAGHIADDDFFYRVGAFTDVVGISQPLASYREHAGSITGQLQSAYLRLAQDYVYQLRQNRPGTTLLAQAELVGLQRLAVKLINELLCYSLRQHNHDWLTEAFRLRQELETLAPGAMAAALPAWAKPLWRLAEGSAQQRLAGGYLHVLDSGLRVRRLLRAPGRKG